MQKFNSLYVCPKHFILKGEGDVCNVVPYGSITNINTKDTNMRLYNGDTLELDVSQDHPDVSPLYKDYEHKAETAFNYDLYDNRGKPSFDPKILEKLRSKADKARKKYLNREEVVCRREIRVLVKEWDEYICKVDGIK